MRIAQIAPPIESVPPKLYGGTERVVSWLTEELVALGHDVTLFASGDSDTTARLVPSCRRALRLDPAVQDRLPYYMAMLSKLRRLADRFDVMHFHIDHFHFPVFEDLARRTVTTLHGRQDIGDLQVLYRSFPEMPLVTISDSQRRFISRANVVRTIHHGLPADLYEGSHQARGGYLAFLGRVSREKGLDRAIEIAHAAGVPLRIAAKVDREDAEFFEAVLKPMLSRPGVEFIGEIGESEKQAFLGNARALLFPIDWPEPFGLVLIEAMACGTPVLAFRNGSVQEIVEDGVTGHVVDTIEEAICRIGAVMALDRARIRRRFEERFTARRMALDYLDVYRQITALKDEAGIVADQLPLASAAE